MKALVTGGASGLGEAITRALSALPGASVHFTYHHSEAAAARLEAELPHAKGIRCDFKSDADQSALAEAAGTLDPDVLVHNAITGMHAKHFHKRPAGDFLVGFIDNVMPVIRLTQAVLPGFRAKRSGRIITILTSNLVNRPAIGMSEYVAAKAYLYSLAKSWAVENAAFGIASNCVSPAFMETHLTREWDLRVVEGLAEQHPLKRLLRPAEVAGTVAFLAGAASAHINGANIVINAAGDIL
jgi:3-oxoacyl-[acyl-carrier protein] reductase